MAAADTLPQCQARAGEESHLARLVDENLGWLQGWLRGRVGDPELVHDISQEAFLKAFQHLSRMRDPARFPGLLYRTAENLLLDHLRRLKRRRTRLATTEELDGVAAAAAAEDQSELAGRAEDAEKLLRAIRALPPRYREPLLLRHAQDLSYEEIASILGIKRSAVPVRMFRARQMLRARCDGHSA